MKIHCWGSRMVVLSAVAICATVGVACSAFADPDSQVLEVCDVTKGRLLGAIAGSMARSMRTISSEAAQKACDENFLLVSNIMHECALDCNLDRLDDGTAFMMDVIGGCDGAYKNIPYYLAIDDEYVYGGALFPAVRLKNTSIVKNTNIVEFVTLANRIVVRGSFEYDPDFGVVIYKHSVPASVIRKEGKAALGMVYGFPVMEIDLHSEAYKAVLNGEKTPKEAIKIVEEKLKRIDDDIACCNSSSDDPAEMCASDESLEKRRQIERVWYQVGHTTNSAERAKGLAIIRQAAMEGDARAQCYFASCLRLGSGVKANGREAVKWYRKSAAQGDAEAQYCLALCYYSGRFCEKNVELALRLLRIAAGKGHVDAREALKRLR